MDRAEDGTVNSRYAERGPLDSCPRLMYGPQVLLDLGLARPVAIWRKCVVCDFQSPDDRVIGAHVMRCGSMVNLEHHAEAKRAWLEGLKHRQEKRDARDRRAQEKARKVWEAVGANRASASDGRRASDDMNPDRSQGVGADQAGASVDRTPSPAASVPAPTFTSSGQ